ncbi:hypothetical protein K2Z83_02700 [Oscillochloris sp. ZM17-4]|uniref:hypothetical protein n=1 Tax=Oscillochloris sp. ZM17-4 TaxID=2866714 RepID=UPI001C72F76B|nr:hypothetical protein [Oscillochloris sp. ZM17-4]MBX0326601.1 hypothetical protein [Oscillochloris sp. ZM17-4]
MPGQHGMAQLALLKTRVRLPAAQKQIEAALANAAERAGLLPDELAELLVPTYGLEEVGLRREVLGGVIVDLVVAGGVELRYTRADGKKLAAAPKALKAEHGDALKELSSAAADIKAILPASATASSSSTCSSGPGPSPRGASATSTTRSSARSPAA